MNVIVQSSKVSKGLQMDARTPILLNTHMSAQEIMWNSVHTFQIGSYSNALIHTYDATVIILLLKHLLQYVANIYEW